MYHCSTHHPYNNSRLDLNVEVEIKSPHHGPITWLDVDSAEERYLLTGEFFFCQFLFCQVLQEFVHILRIFFVRAAFLFVFAPLVLAFVALALLYFSFFLVHPIYHLRLLFSLHPIPLLIVVTQIRGHIAGSSPPLPTTVRALHFFRCIFFRKIYYKKKHVSCGLCKLVGQIFDVPGQNWGV